MLGIFGASNRLMARMRPLSVGKVSFASAAGRVLARDIVSPVTLPPWDNSAMDGYAVREHDVRGATPEAPVRLRVVGTIPAGAVATRALEAGEAMRIMTGARIPEGADGVVRLEDTDRGEEHVAINNARDAGRNVRPRGEDVTDGDVVLRAGTPIGPAAMAMLAAVGATSVEVVRRPRVAIIGSGDELVSIEEYEEVRGGRRIVATNNYAIAALVREAGGEPVDLGIAPDDRDALTERIAGAVGADLLVTSGGISVGAHDHTRAVIAAKGSIDFWRIRMRPGSQLACGEVHGIPWIGLPGNPVSALITAELFVRAAVLRLGGRRDVHRVPVRVQLGEPISSPGGSTLMLRAVVTTEVNSRVARLTGPQGSGVLSSMARANALLIVPEEIRQASAGTFLSAIPLESGGRMAERMLLSAER